MAGARIVLDLDWPGEESPGQRDEHQADRKVDKEDRAPALLLAKERKEGSACQRSVRRRDPDRCPEVAECSAALCALKVILNEPDHLRVEDSGRDSLGEPRDGETVR